MTKPKSPVPKTAQGLYEALRMGYIPDTFRSLEHGASEATPPGPDSSPFPSGPGPAPETGKPPAPKKNPA